jgi:hypothetical protein
MAFPIRIQENDQGVPCKALVMMTGIIWLKKEPLKQENNSSEPGGEVTHGNI